MNRRIKLSSPSLGRTDKVAEIGERSIHPHTYSSDAASSDAASSDAASSDAASSVAASSPSRIVATPCVAEAPRIRRQMIGPSRRKARRRTPQNSFDRGKNAPIFLLGLIA